MLATELYVKNRIQCQSVMLAASRHYFQVQVRSLCIFAVTSALHGTMMEADNIGLQHAACSAADVEADDQ